MKSSYSTLIKQSRALFKDKKDLIANMANLSALLFENLKKINWVGFYRLISNQLVLGPFQGKPACIRIAIGDGVCGICVEKKTTIIVPNVHEFKGHIFCDSASNSEIVVPLFKNDQVIGVLDIDSLIYDRFNIDDKIGLETIAKLLTEN